MKRRPITLKTPLLIVRGTDLPYPDLEAATDWYWIRRVALAEAAVPGRRVICTFTREELRGVVAGYHQSELRALRQV